jgi:hypothetical protein
MAHVDADRDFCEKFAFRASGTCALLLLLMSNPLVLRPRYWSAHVVARSLAIDGVLLTAGIGFIALRKWAALLVSALSVLITFEFLRQSAGMAVPVMLATQPILTVVFWRTLIWGDRRSNALLVARIVLVDALIHSTAFIVRRA